MKSFLSERISQDPLEKYFGRQRQRGGVNENPTGQEFLKNNSALRMVNSITIETHKSNVKHRNADEKMMVVSTEPLKKKRKIPQPSEPQRTLPSDAPSEPVNQSSAPSEVIRSLPPKSDEEVVNLLSK